MRKNAILIVVTTSLIPLIGIFASTDLYHSHDGLVHLPRLAAFFKSLTSPHFPVRWAADLNYGFGMPLFNFIYTLPYLIGSFFIALGIGLTLAFKLAISLSFILSGIFMFLFTKEFFEDEKKALVVTTLYQFAPFHLIELLVRGSFGEVYTYTFLPLVLLFLARFNKTQSLANGAGIALGVALLVLSHNSISLVFFVVSVLFMLFFVDSIKNKIKAGAFLLLGLGASAYYWLPAVYEHKYTYGNLFAKDLFKDHFPPFQNFFIPNLTNAQSLQTEGIVVFIGLFNILAIVAAIVAIIQKKIDSFDKKLLYFTLILLAGSFFLMQPISEPVWSNLPFLKQFQFPWRLLSVVVFATSLLGIMFFKFRIFTTTWAVVGLLTFTILSSAAYLYPPLGTDEIDEDYYWNFPLNTTYYGETDLVWSAGQAAGYPDQPVEIIEGEGEISNYSRTPVKHAFDLNAETNVTILDNTQYYPGWTPMVDGVEKQVQFQNPNHRGLITFEAEQGQHSVVVQFEETKFRTLTNVLSFASVLVIVSLLVIGRFISNVKK